MEGMSDIERLVALEDIRMLKARRDQAIDTKNWELYHSLHAPHHVSHNEGFPRWEGPDAMIEGTRNATAGLKTVHHSHTPDITFESPTKAKGIWGMEDLLFDEETLELVIHGFGFYHEEYEKVDGTWKFVWRQLKRTLVLTREDGNLPGQTRS
ncbi:MAG: nuclear transport factor 2 family protein [Sphingomonadaceae bacterium]|nr:nuclear transport factor 2 family protein [Sphingomonadaceae bacterium]